MRSDLLRLDTTATQTRQAAASDQHRAKKKNVRPRVTVRIDRRPESVLPFFRVFSSSSCIRFSPPVDRQITLLLGVICHCSCLGTAAGRRTTTAPATDTATARSSPAEDGATNPRRRRRTALDARQMAACWPAGCCRDLACCGGFCFVCVLLVWEIDSRAGAWLVVSGVSNKKTQLCKEQGSNSALTYNNNTKQNTCNHLPHPHLQQQHQTTTPRTHIHPFRRISSPGL